MRFPRVTGRLWLCLAALAVANLASAGTPEDAVKAYMTTFQQGGVEKTAGHFHPAELERFRNMLMPIFRVAVEKGGDQGLEMFFGKGTTLAKVEALSPLEFMSSFLSFISTQIKEVKVSSFEVLGSVPEKDLVHVVTRISMEGPKSFRMSKLEVVTTKRDGANWKLALTGQMEGIAEAMKSR